MRIVVLCMAIVGAVALTRVGADREATSGATGSPTSVEALAREALAGLAVGDTARLGRLRLTEREHNQRVWPELPASRPEANFPVDLAWQNIQLRNRAAVARLLVRYGHQPLEYEDVECRGATERFDTFHVLTDCWVTFRSRGDLRRAQLFRYVLVRNGEHRIFRYYD